MMRRWSKRVEGMAVMEEECVRLEQVKNMRRDSPNGGLRPIACG
jgi:hypothetical protein